MNTNPLVYLAAMGLFLLLIFQVFPIVYNIYLSLTTFKFGRLQFQGFANYVKLIKDPLFGYSLLKTLFYALGSIIPPITIALFLAKALNRPGIVASILRSIYFFPVAISPIVAAVMWRAFLNPDVGFVNYILEFLGFPKFGWYTSEAGAMPTLWIVTIWKNVGYYMIILLAGLQSIPKEYYDAAKIDGANEWQIFMYLTIPLLKPYLTFTYIVGFIFSFNVFDLVFVLTKGGPGYATMVTLYYIYREGFVKFQISYAATISVALLIIVLAFTISQLRFLRAFVVEEVV